MDIKKLTNHIAKDIKTVTSTVNPLNPSHIIEDGWENFLGSIPKNLEVILPVLLWHIKENPEILEIPVSKPMPKKDK